MRRNPPGLSATHAHSTSDRTREGVMASPTEGCRSLLKSPAMRGRSLEVVDRSEENCDVVASVREHVVTPRAQKPAPAVLAGRVVLVRTAPARYRVVVVYRERSGLPRRAQADGAEHSLKLQKAVVLFGRHLMPNGQVALAGSLTPTPGLLHLSFSPALALRLGGHALLALTALRGRGGRGVTARAALRAGAAALVSASGSACLRGARACLRHQPFTG